MSKRLILLIIFVIFLFSASPSYAAKKLYITDHCESCHEVMEKGKELIDELVAKGELEIIDVTGIKTDLPSVPALVDGETVIIGTGILEYIRRLML